MFCLRTRASEWNFKDTSNKKFEKFITPNFPSLISLHLINFNYIVHYSTLSSLMPPREFQSLFCLMKLADFIFVDLSIFKSHFINDSENFYAEQPLREYSPTRNNTPEFLNSTALSGALAREVITIFSVASAEP